MTARVCLTTIVLLLAGGAAARGASLVLQLRPEHQAHAERIQDAAAEAITQFTEWFGDAPFEQLTIASGPAGLPPAADQRGRLSVPMHWLQPARSLLMEAEIARGIARQWWGVAVTMPDQFLADGIADYAQSRAVERIYDRRHQRLAYSTYEARYFGGLLPWAIRALRLERTTAGINRSEYRRHPDVDVRSVDAELRPARAAKVAAALLTLERYIGWPSLQRGLRLAMDRYRGRTMTAEDFARTMSDAADRDLAWFFDPLFNGPTHWDYAVESITSEPLGNSSCGAGPCIRSTVVLLRSGNTAFTGTVHQPAGGFQAGRAMEVELRFADGQTISERWDGRDERRTLVFDAPSPIVTATVDPRDVLALDLTRLNNQRSTATTTSAGPAAWTARWTIWLQDLLLTHAVLF